MIENREMLEELVIDQLRAQQTRPGQDVLTFADFMSLNRIARLDMVADKMQNEGFRSPHDIRVAMASNLFCQIAYRTLAAKQPEGHVVLSPNRTVKFVQHLYPYRTIREHGAWGEVTVNGATTHDGLVVNGNYGLTLIEACCEYTVLNDPRKVDDYIDGKMLGFAREKEARPAIFCGSTLLFVTPDKSLISRKIKEGNFRPKYGLRKDEVEVETLDFTHGEFAEFIGEVCHLLRGRLRFEVA